MHTDDREAGGLSCYEALKTRRSVRKLRPDPVPRGVLRRIVETACWAPAPHHTRPWRFAVVAHQDGKEQLAGAMSARWSADLTVDGIDEARIERVTARSRNRIVAAGALVLISLVKGELQRYPDTRRQSAEYTMGAHSVGAAIENLLLAAHDSGLAGSWMCAPLFCPEAVRAALELPETWEPQALILLGYPLVEPAPRPPADLSELIVWVGE